LGIALIINNNLVFPSSIIITWYQSKVSSIDRRQYITNEHALGRAHVVVPVPGHRSKEFFDFLLKTLD